MRRVVHLEAAGVDPATMDGQQRQDVDGPVSHVLELALLDRPGDGPADRVPFEHLPVGHLISAQHPESRRREPLGVGVAPEHPLGARLELRVDAPRAPVARPVRLEVDRGEEPAPSPRLQRAIEQDRVLAF